MNFRRGFKRLFIAFAVSWYVLGSLYLYSAWSSHYSSQKHNLDRCLDAARQDNEQSQVAQRDAPPRGLEGYVPINPKDLPLQSAQTSSVPGAKSQLKPPPKKLYDIHGNLLKLPEGYVLDQPVPEPQVKLPKGWTLIDEKGNPISESQLKLPKGYENYQPVPGPTPTLTAESCRAEWIVAPSTEETETAFVLLFPLALYGIAKVLAWIGKGFRDAPPPVSS